MRDRFVIAVLEQFTPPADDVPLDWHDVLERAAVQSGENGTSNGKIGVLAGSVAATRARRRLSSRLVISLATVIAAGVVAVTPAGPAIIQAFADFTAWVSGGPGTPASREEQRAFEQATRSWLAFPSGVGLRRLIRTRAGGVSFNLDGYRVGDELCLRLLASGAASSSRSSCVPLRELRARKQPALVVFVDVPVGTLGRQRVRIGPSTYPVLRTVVTAGIVADGVQSVDVSGDAGRHEQALVAGDSFLAVIDRPPAAYRTRHVRATTSRGARIVIPFAPQGLFGASPYSSVTRQPKPRGPLGPARVERRVRGGSIEWLTHREQRGAPVPPNAGVKFDTSGHPITFERLIAPDPNSPLKLVVAYGPWGPWVCEAVVLGAQSPGGCTLTDELFANGPVTGSMLGFFSDQYNIHYGFASDAVARITVFLANGKRLTVPLRDNVYLVQVPRTGYPARLVAYDRHGRVIGVNTTPDLSALQIGGPAAGARWRTVVRVTSDGALARLMLAPAANGGICYSIVFGKQGDGNISCPTGRWRGPPLQLGFNDLIRGTFFSGSVRPGISRIKLHLPDGRVIGATSIKGQVLIAIPSKYARRRHQGSYIVAFDRHGREILRGQPEN